ncbi:hypothetical protein TRAPUB_9177 [Trametes pubescens]|uniref:Succinate/fumarate mitochondrial transporter n=1 Tax=Trametes pubescens TaxID=154538 RepID=A0A1M2W3D3_TRAPU|nr:hypothetical protein TRAPUB_9177 [Trametes pubescens]
MIVQREMPLALYKGLGEPRSGALRHRPQDGHPVREFRKVQGTARGQDLQPTRRREYLHQCAPLTPLGLYPHPNPPFLTAGLGAGVTEAVLVVTPMEVVKIRLQA